MSNPLKRALDNEIRAVNTVTRLITMPCNVPYTVIVETAFPALGKAVLQLLSFGAGDVIRGAVTPKGLRGSKRRPKGKTRTVTINGKKVRLTIPEIGNEIGKSLPGAKLFASRAIGPAQRLVFVLDGISQRALYFFLIADIIGDFAYNWSSSIIKDACTPSEANAQRLVARITTTFFGISEGKPIGMADLFKFGIQAIGSAFWQVIGGPKPMIAIATVQITLTAFFLNEIVALVIHSQDLKTTDKFIVGDPKLLIPFIKTELTVMAEVNSKNIRLEWTRFGKGGQLPVSMDALLIVKSVEVLQ